MTIQPQRLTDLRQQLAAQGLDAFLVPTQDSFLSEYVPAWEQRLRWLTGFDGSAGMAVVTAQQAALLTDGRYTLQARNQLGQEYEVQNNAATSPAQWLQQHLPQGATVGIDIRLFSARQLESLEKQLKAQGLNVQHLRHNPIDDLWHGRPATAHTPLTIHDLTYAGESQESKRTRLVEELRSKGAGSMLITAPDSIAWLLNIRANDVAHVPTPLCTALLTVDDQYPEGRIQLFIDPARVPPDVRTHLGSSVDVLPPDQLPAALRTQANNPHPMLYDPALTPYVHIADAHQNQTPLLAADDPIQRMKAQKNPTEIAGAVTAHIRDGVALTRFLHELATRTDLAQETEYSLGERLKSLRLQDPTCLDLSFDSIIGFQSNGAIVHYRAPEQGSRPIQGDGLLLIDSGGQYREGTTDVTRTIAIGTPTPEHIASYTAVLKGHIALGMARFPVGTNGGQLDSLARHPLWQEGKDYDHGTGHGVGSYLSVHEGPARIGKAGAGVPLQPGMILSNEPGYYKNGDADTGYGIRIENLITVTEAPQYSVERPFLMFHTLTLAPYDRRLINTEQLTDVERQWVDAYHAQVYQTLAPLLPTEAAQWLKEQTKPLSCLLTTCANTGPQAAQTR